MKTFVIGIGGGVGRRLATTLLSRGDQVAGLARRAEQVSQLAQQGVAAVAGDMVAMSVEELAQSMRGSDAVVFAAGAGGKGGPDATRVIDGEGPGKVAAAAKLAGVQRFVLVSVFPEAWRDRSAGEAFEHYIRQKKQAEVALVQSGMDWVILRPSALTDEPGTGRVSMGPAQIHGEIPRDDVATTIAHLLHELAVSRTVLEVTGGGTAIATAAGAVSNH